MFESIWHFMSGTSGITTSAHWIWHTIFLGWSRGLWNWYLICKAEPWPIIPLDVAFSLIAVCVLLYLLWVGGSIIAWLGVMPAIVMAWTILWIIYYFAIPIYGSLIISEFMRLPKRWQKLMTLIIIIAYTVGIISAFDTGIAIWFLVMTLIYLGMIFEAIPYKTNTYILDALI